ncbi:MAG: hypothetical protein IPM54_40355 [Polyangiaceae bacterium]|nr:hypothetical protein [Polyangiaceae bacterium]
MRAPVLVLGSNPVHLGEDALVEPPDATLGDIEALLEAKPRAALITSGGEAGFFRASLCLERGVLRVVLRRGAFEDAWERELSARAATFGAELFVHDDARGYGRVKPGARFSVGAPDATTWTRNASGLVIDAAWEEIAQNAVPLAMDPDIEGLPSNLEEVAFVNGDKPVLYLVVPTHDVNALRSKYSTAMLVCHETPLYVESATGRRVYEVASRETNSHVFISNDAALAQRAARLWDEGSSRNAVAIGELMGYPPCCVAAFVALGERGNNAALTYVTAARSRALGATFHAYLNSAVRHVIPCTPCSFGCSKAIRFAGRVLEALESSVSSALCKALGRPVLYFDEARAIAFEGARVDAKGIEYEEARFLPASAPLDPDEELRARRLFGALLAGPGKFVMKDDVFEVHAGGTVRRIARTNPKLGVLLPFPVEEIAQPALKHRLRTDTQSER